MKHVFIFFATGFFLTGYARGTNIPEGKKAGTNPNGFIENKGQVVDQNYKPNPEVKYLFCSHNFNVQLRQTGFSYDTYTDSFASSSPKNDSSRPKKFQI